MATFALVHGGGSNAHYWYRVAPLLTAAGHEAVAVNLPTADESATFETYAQAVVDAVDGKPNVVVVGQSMGAFTAPIVATRMHVSLIALVAPMIPAPGETPGTWGANVGLEDEQRRYAKAEGFDPAFDLMTTFMHDVPTDVVNELMSAGEPVQAGSIFGQPWPLSSWPQVTTKVVACRNDRLFPIELVRRLASERLGVKVDEIDSGHLPGFARPKELAKTLLGYV